MIYGTIYIIHDYLNTMKATALRSIHVFGRRLKQVLFTGFSLNPVKSEKEKKHISDFSLGEDFSTLRTWT